MPTKITGILPPSNFELIRDQLASVLRDEIANQKTLDATLIEPKAIWVERFTPFVNTTELPAINIRYQSASFDEKSRTTTQVTATHTYYIDISYIAKSKPDNTGDRLAAFALEHMCRIVRAVLANPAYNTLGFTAPFNKRAWVNSIEVFEPMEFADATNQINGRVEYCIEVNEYSQSYASGTLIREVTTTVTLKESERGFYLDILL